MSDTHSLETLLEQERRSIAMLPPGAALDREAALRLIDQCQRVLAATRHPAADPPRPRRPRS